VLTFDTHFKTSDKPITLRKAEAIRRFDETKLAFSISVVNAVSRGDDSRVTVSGDLLVSYTSDKPADLSYHFTHVYTKVDHLQLSSVETVGQDWPNGWPHNQR
jgi:hypothetical protein